MCNLNGLQRTKYNWNKLVLFDKHIGLQEIILELRKINKLVVTIRDISCLSTYLFTEKIQIKQSQKNIKKH